MALLAPDTSRKPGHRAPMNQTLLNIAPWSPQSLRLQLAEAPQGFVGCNLFAPDPSPSATADHTVPLFQVGVAGCDAGSFGAMSGCYPRMAAGMELVSASTTGNRTTLDFETHTRTLRVTVVLESVPNLPVLRVHTSARNIGAQPITLTQLSSCLLGGIAAARQHETDIHYCTQTWQAEGQWHRLAAATVPLQRASVHPDTGVFRLRSSGSFSTASFWPLIILTNDCLGAAWFAQLETSSGWCMEVGSASGWGDETGCLYLQASGADERQLGWVCRLAPGEEFQAPPVAVGTVSGGWQEAVQTLTAYRRHLLRMSGITQRPRAFFNDYMNCLWGDPTREKLLPLIRAAGELGCEGFCIDAGWFGSREQPFGPFFGVWGPSTDRFGDGGLQSVLDEIRIRGMIPGLWLEMEVCDPTSPIARNPDDWFLHRHGTRILSNDRLFLDYRHPAVRQHMHAVIDRLVAMGVGFFKNDYNECLGWGAETANGSPAQGLLEHAEAFQGFLRELRRRHPNVIIETCASGAMRTDWGLLQVSDLQSTSDQEDYFRYPSILIGSLALIPPERAGIWAYPYPHRFLQKADATLPDSPGWREEMADPEQTIFNMVNGLCGVLYLSGRVDRAGEENHALIREAIALWKHLRGFLAEALPMWPLGTMLLHQLDRWAAIGFDDPETGRFLLAVWRLDGGEDELLIPLPSLCARAGSWSQAFPRHSHRVPFGWSPHDAGLRVGLQQTRIARLFEFCPAQLSPMEP